MEAQAPGTGWSTLSGCGAPSRCRFERSPTTGGGSTPGPRTGLAELALPDLQPGSSIMPGEGEPDDLRGDE